LYFQERCKLITTFTGDEDKNCKIDKMVDTSYFRHFESDLDDPSVGPKWIEWLDELELYLVFVNIANDERKKAALLHHAGSSISKIYRTVQLNPLPDPAAAEGEGNQRPIDTYNDVKRKMSAYFNPKKNKYFEVHTFRQAKQLKGETLDNYATRLRQLSHYCEFACVETEIVSQIIEGGLDSEIASKALRTGEELTLNRLLDWGRVRSITSSQVSQIKSGGMDCVNWVSRLNTNSQARSRGARQEPTSKALLGKSCYRCGGPNKDCQNCPAIGKSCKNCGKLSHFARVCRSAKSDDGYYKSDARRQHTDARSDNKIMQKVICVTEKIKENNDDGEQVYLFSLRSMSSDLPRAVVNIAGMNVQAVIDTGASINVVSNEFYESVRDRVKLQTRDNLQV